jgi:hypothetical protein
VPKITNSGNPQAISHVTARPLGGRLAGNAMFAEVSPAVVTAILTSDGEDPSSETELGTEHVDCAGAPVQLSATG